MTPLELSKGRDLIHDIHEYSINYENREIYLHSYFSNNTSDEEEPGVDYRMANIFIKNINMLNSINNNNILIHQQTMGGEWNYGIAIYDSIRLSKSTISMLAYSWSRSMSSITIQACDNRILMPHTDFMVHLGSVYVEGTAQEVYTTIDQCKRSDRIMLDIYASRCINGSFFKKKGYDKIQIKKYILNKMNNRTDWWLDPQEAIDYGFIDGVYGERGFKDIDKIRNVKKKRFTLS